MLSRAKKLFSVTRTLSLVLCLSVIVNIYLFVNNVPATPTTTTNVVVQIQNNNNRIRWQFPFVNEDEPDPPHNTTKLPYPYYSVEFMGNNVSQCFTDYCQTNRIHEDMAFLGKGTIGCSNGDHQDLLLFSSLWRHPTMRRGGVVVEIGGMTGWEASNSLFLEKCLGWKAIIFELTPINFAHLQKNRPDAITIHGTVCSEVSFVYVLKSGAGCCTRAISANETQYANNPDYMKVPCKPMTAWLKEYGVTAVDYLSLDTEGYELTILETIDWQYNSVHAISIEMLYKDLVGHELYEKNKRSRVVLDQLGLTYIPWLSLANKERFNRDDVWVNQSWII